MPYKAFDKCVWKSTNEGKKLGKDPVGCTKGDVKKYLSALYANDPKAAKNELAAIVEAFNEGKRREALMAELTQMHETVKGMYEGMNEDLYEDTLSEIEKMHMEMKNLYAELFKLK